MKIIANIPDEMVQEIKEGCFGAKHTLYDLAGAICNGVVLPDNSTNGDMIKAMFPYACFEEYEDECRHIVIMWADGKASIVRSDFEWYWWNAPYKGGKDNGNDN